MVITTPVNRTFSLYPNTIEFRYLKHCDYYAGNTTVQYSQCTITSSCIQYVAISSLYSGTYIEFYDDNNNLFYTARIGASTSWTAPADFFGKTEDEKLLMLYLHDI